MQPLAEAELEAIWNAMDDNNSGRLEQLQFVAATLPNHLYLGEVYVRRAFKGLDRDSSGFITLQNLQQVLLIGARAEPTHTLAASEAA